MTERGSAGSLPPIPRRPHLRHPNASLATSRYLLEVFAGKIESMSDKSPLIEPVPELFARVAPGLAIPDPIDAPALRWGILGAGGIARTFARDVPQYSLQQVVAVGSRERSRAEAFAADCGIPSTGAYGSYEDLVAADDVDAIYVATPHMRHHCDALLALEAGKPVLVEKSFSTSVEKAREVFDFAAAQGLFAMEAMWSRHLPHYHFIREAVAAGVLGNLIQVTADHSQRLTHIRRLVDPELAGGAMLDLGVYSISLVQMAMGRPRHQTASGRLSDRGIDLGEIVTGVHDTGLSVASSTLEAATATPALLAFEGGTIAMPHNFYQPTKVELTVHELDGSGVISSSDNATWDARVPGGFQYEAAEAARQITAGNLESPAAPWQATIEVQEMMNAALREIGVEYPQWD